MEVKKIRQRILTLILLTFICTRFFSNIIAVTVDEYKNQIEKIKEKEKSNVEKLSGIEKQVAQYSYEIADLDSKMAKYSSDLSDLQAKVDEVNNKIKGYEDDLQNSAQRYNSAEDMYNTRIRAIYENGMPSLLDILFKSEGISDFFSKISVYNSILEYDRALVENVKSEKEYINNIKKDIEIQKTYLEQLKYDVEKSTNALNNAIDSKQKKMDALKSSEIELKATNEALKKKREDATKKLEEEIERISKEDTGNTFTGTQFVWPVSGYVGLTVYFNEYYDFGLHKGVDVAGANIARKPILAIESGTVATASYMQNGYGNYVIINHGKCTNDGNTYMSLYGHASSLVVKTGQKVAKGQVIGYVGTTGLSTGNHLHFEIRINTAKNKVDPLKFYPAMKFYRINL